MMTKEMREQFLVKLNEMAGGNIIELFESMEIGDVLGFDRGSTFNIVRYLERKGYVIFGDDTGSSMRITAEGIDEADRISSIAAIPSFRQEELDEEWYFSPGSELDIQKELAKVLRQAMNSLWICDPYMDERIIEEISNIPASDIRLLTAHPKELFKPRLSAAKRQFPEKTIEAKLFSLCHDRFYIIDRLQIWTLGTSLNKAGEKATVFNKLKDEGVKQEIATDFDKWWTSAVESKA